MARRKTSRSRGRKTTHILSLAAGINALIQLLKPTLDAGLMGAIKSGDAAAIGSALGTGTKAALAWENLIQAFGPLLAVKALKFGMARLGISNPRVGRIAAV